MGTVDYVDKDGKTLAFQTTAEEKGRVIFQMGSRNPEWAAKAAKLVAADVAAIDLNMGCPKRFSIQVSGVQLRPLCEELTPGDPTVCILEDLRSVLLDPSNPLLPSNRTAWVPRCWTTRKWRPR